MNGVLSDFGRGNVATGRGIPILAALLCLALALAGCGGLLPPPQEPVTKPDLWLSPSATRIDIFRPVASADAAADAHVPAVIVLHGASGAAPGGAVYRQAQALADAGIAAFLVHYMSGMTQSDPSDPRYYDRREAAIREAIDRVYALPWVDRERIGLYGYSLGGFHALGLAGRDSRLRAIASTGGALSRNVALPKGELLPPILLVHGERDATVPVARVKPLARQLEKMGGGNEVKFYRNQGHVFQGTDMDDSIRRTVAFFSRTLDTSRATVVSSAR